MKNRRIIYIVLYYLILLLIMATRTNASSEPPLVLRLAFLGAIITPCLLTNLVSYSAVITVFYSLAIYGFAYSYMPYMIYIYVILTIIMVVLSVSIKRALISPPVFLVFFAIYVFIVDLFNGFGKTGAHLLENNFYCFLILIMFLLLAGKDKDKTISQLSLGFSIITITLSIIFLLNREQFASDYGLSGLEREGWTDPNYFGMVLGMGTVVGLTKLLGGRWKEYSLLVKVIYLFSIAISIPVLLLNASRGAILSVIVAFVVLIMLSKTKNGLKLFITIIAAVFVYILYDNQYFDLLEYRMMEDDGTGSNRTAIWDQKLQAFFQGNPVNMFFGYGYYKGLRINGRVTGFHNDFIAFLVDYGLVGLCFLSYMLYYPYKLLPRHSEYKPAVVVAIVYLFVCFCTLEPFSGGYLAFYFFYFYGLLLAINAKQLNQRDCP